MYTLTYIKLSNICQYSDFEHAISPGLTAVIGRNGVGKTNLLRALAYGLTGFVDGLWGSQQDLQSDMTSTPGYVCVYFTDGKDRYMVRRFSTSSAKFADSMEMNDKPFLLGRKKVNAFMDTVFGMPCLLMFQVCWGRQGELSSLLKSTPAMVSSFLSMVFDTRQLERLRERIKLQMDTIANLPADCERQLQKAKDDLEALRSDEDLDKVVSDAKGTLDAVGGRLESMKERTRTCVDPEARRQMLARLDEAISYTRASLDDIPEVAEAPEGLLPEDTCTKELSSCETMRTAGLSACGQQESTLAAARQTVSSEKAAVEELDKLHGKVVDTLDNPHADCPLCHGRIDDINKFEASVLLYLTGSYTDRNEYEAHYSQDRADHAMRMASAMSTVTSLELELADAYGKMENLARRIALLRDMEAYNKGTRLRRQLAELTERRAQVEASRTVDESFKAEMAALNTQLSAAKTAYDAAISLRAETQARRSMLTQYVADFEKAVRQYHVNRDARQALSDIRDALSQNRAQARYLKAGISRLNAALAKYISYTGMPFTVRLDTDTRTFVFVTSDGSVHQAGQLSGAQQAMSAVALQMALFSVMQPNMNLYLIDEPAEALDDGNKNVMAQMFERMNNMLPSVDGVMLIVARDEQTIASCGNIIEVTHEE